MVESVLGYKITEDGLFRLVMRTDSSGRIVWVEELNGEPIKELNPMSPEGRKTAS